jgi:pimeloyl-ACP methyl ester carboxylesterase
VKVAKAGSFPVPLDAAKLHYVGQSLGGFNGTLFAAVNDDVKNVMLNVPGSDQVGLLLTAPGFAAERAGFLAGLRGQGLSPGMPAFDQLMTLLRTIFDKADPLNFAFSAVNHALTPARKIYIHSIEGDLVVPNALTDKLIAAATAGGGVIQQERVVPPVSLMASDRHGFLLNFKDTTLTGTAQQKAAVFLSTGVAP